MFRYILIIICLYIYIYSPNLVSLAISTSVVLYPLVFWLIFREFTYLYKYQRIFIFWFITSVFIIVRTLCGGESVFLYSWIGYLIETILLSIALSIIITKNQYDIVRLLLICGAVAATISCLCLFIPPLDDIIRTIQVERREGGDAVIFRGFGLSQGLNFEYGIIQALIFSIGLLNLKDNKWFSFFMPFVILSIFINARSGSVVVALSILAYILYKKSFIIPIISLAVITVLFLSLRSYIPDDTYVWIEEFFLEVKDAMLGTDSAQFNTRETLTNDMVIWPNDIESWIFGLGHSLFRTKSGPSSDIGYINQLAYGGVVFCALLYCLSYFIIKKGRNYLPKLYFIFIIMSLLIMNIKGDVFGSNGGIFKLLALFSFSLYQLGLCQNKTLKLRHYEDTVC